MATATVQVASVGGYAGATRCFKIDPPFRGHEYVSICATTSFGDIVGPKAEVFPADESGACTETSLKSRPGSFNLHDEPDTPERLDGAYWMALQLLGGYQIAPQDA